jgi:hypothetical protein
MNLKQIQIGKWYQTKQGDGICIAFVGSSLKFEFSGKACLVSPAEVQFEIHKDQEPTGAHTSILEVLETVKRHVDDLAEAFKGGALRDCGTSPDERANRNKDVQHALDVAIKREKEKVNA